MIPSSREFADAFLRNLASNSDDSLTNFTQSIGVLLSSPNRAITTTAMEMVARLIWNSSAKSRLALVKADLIPRLVNTLHHLSLSFTEAVDIHIHIMKIIRIAVWLATPNGLARLALENGHEKQAVHETVLTKLLIPSEQYICHFCVNRFSIVDGDQSVLFLEVLATVLRICPYYPQTMDFVLNVPVFLTISSCLTFFEKHGSILSFLSDMNDAQREWNEEGEDVREMWKTVHRMLRMEGFEDLIEIKLQNARNGDFGGWIAYKSIEWNNQLGMNVQNSY